MRKNKLMFGILVFGLLFIFILSSNSTTKTVRASYSDNIGIDNIKEPEYENIINFDGYKIYYAYNDSYHFLFIITPFNFTSEIIEIRDQNDELICIFSPTFQPPSFIGNVKFNNNTLEIKMNRAVIDVNDFAIKIGSYPHLFILKVDPTPKTTTPEYIYYGEEEDGKEEKEKPDDGLNLDWLDNPATGWIFGFVIAYLAVAGYRYTETYRTYYKDIQGKNKYAGRFLCEEPSNIIHGYRELYFKRWGKLHKIFSKREYINKLTPEYLDFKLFKYFGDIIYREIDMSKFDIILYEREPVNDLKNKLRYYFFKCMSIIPGVMWINKLKNNIEYQNKMEMENDLDKPKKKHWYSRNKTTITYYQKKKLDEDGNTIPMIMKKIPIVQHQLSFDKINYICDVEFDKMETTEDGEKKFRRKEKNKSLFYVNDLRRNKKVLEDTIKETNLRKAKVEVITDYDMERAILEPDSIDNVRSIADLKTAIITKENIELGMRLNITRKQLDDSNRTFELRVKDNYYKIVQNITSDKSTLRDIMDDTLKYFNLTGNMDDAIKISLENHFKRIEGKQYGQLEFKLEAEKAKSKLLEEQNKKSKKQMSMYPQAPTEDEEDEGDGTNLKIN